KRGERVVVHGAAGGVGVGAGQLARHLGGGGFAAAHPSKWGTLRAVGLGETHIASPRDLAFKHEFMAAAGGRGVDVVLGSLAGEMVDASLSLLPGGGRYIEMGKTDIRDPELIASERRGVSYQAFELDQAGPERLGEILDEVLGLLERRVLELLP